MKQTQTVHKMVCLYTGDVPGAWLHVLRDGRIGWDTRQVELLECDSLYASNSQGGRFAGTFTKLHAIRLEQEFCKVTLLDADLLVRGNIDHLFDRACPAAVRRHAGGDTTDGELMDFGRFTDGHGRPRSGINAGVIVLRTSRAVFEDMIHEMGRPHGSHMKSGATEQDFLSRWYSLLLAQFVYLL